MIDALSAMARFDKGLNAKLAPAKSQETRGFTCWRSARAPDRTNFHVDSMLARLWPTRWNIRDETLLDGTAYSTKEALMLFLTPRMKDGIKFGVLLLLSCFAVSCYGQQVPVTKAKALDGSNVELPDPASAKPLLLVIGFSHKSSNQTQAWDKRLAPLYLENSSVSYYEVADFQGVPQLVMKMILHGMRREIPTKEHSHFVLLESNEQEWKKMANFSAADEAYLIVAGGDGKVLWQTHGAMTDADVVALQKAISLAVPSQK
jgi:hypothetical protein